MSRGKISEKKDDNTFLSSSQLNYPVFCFKYLTTNNSYNINYFKKSTDKAKAYGALFYIINHLQGQTWLETMNKRKQIGFESIAYKTFNFKPNGYKLSKDDKLLVIRFKRGLYRMIGIKSDVNKDVFHVLGFDFDYSAYDHG